MSDKLPVLIAYALFGIALALAPFLLSRVPLRLPISPTQNGLSRDEQWATAISAGLALVALYVSHSLASLVLAPVFVVIALLFALHRGRIDRDEAVGAVAALVIAATLPWWRRADDGLLMMDWTKLPAFFLAGLAACHALRPAVPRKQPAHAGIAGILGFCFLLIAAMLSFNTGFFPITRLDGLTVGNVAWHHWGAYIGPSEMVRAGARLFHDVPAQYGLGPTVLIASLCSPDCWSGMYWLVGCTSLAFFILIATMAHQLRGPGQTPAAQAIVMLLCVVCCMLWTAYPADMGSSITTPSVGGLRFLPVVGLVALLFWTDTRAEANAAEGQPSRWGHVVWALGALWSPESAFCVTFAWWPYYLWRRCARSAKGEVVPNLVRAAGILLLTLAALVGFFLAAYRLAYGTNPTQVGFFANFLYPPGASPINPAGGIWFSGTVLLLGLAALRKIYLQSGDSKQFRRAFLVLLLAYGTFSYFLGRSVDNNLLNLLPFQLLVLLVVLDSGLPKAWRQMAVVLAACLLAWSSFFGWSVWMQLTWSGGLLEYDPSRRIRLFKQNPDAERAVAFIREKFGEPATVLDYRLNLTVTPDGAAWSAIHGPANYYYLPPEMRREFLANTAQALRRAGWMVVLKQSANSGQGAQVNVNLVDPGGLMRDISHIYRPTQGLDFGTYHAIRFEPR